MPSPTDPLDTDRLEALLEGDVGDNERERELQGVLRELRASKPEAPPELRERVRALREPERAPRWGLARLRPRRAALVLVPACFIVAVGAIALSGRDGGGDQVAGEALRARGEPSQEAGGGGAVPQPAVTTALDSASEDSAAAAESSSLAPYAPQRQGVARAPAPAPRRAQDYRADLTVLVDDVGELSIATQQAMRITRSLGGFVVSANYGKPVGEDGDSTLTVRVPVTRVQEAIARFGELGTIIAQNIAIRDLQGQLNRQTESIASLRKTIARIEKLLQDQSLRAETRARLEFQLNDTRRALSQQTSARSQTLRTARLSHVSLTLTTRDEGVVAPPAPPSEFKQTLQDAVGVLGTIVAWTLATVIVLSPFIALVAAAWLLSRAGRRRANAALLERS